MKKYHLLVVSPTISIEEFVMADDYWVEHGAYYFFKFEGDQDDDGYGKNRDVYGKNRIVQCVYPINLTIIKSIEVL
jgi:hypothetical protein